MSKKRVRTLLRVSSKQQLHDNDIPIQRAEAEQFIAKQPDWEFDKEYIEKAVSAYKNGVKDREVLQQILKDASNKEFDILLTYMSDRIGRQEEYSTYVATLNSLGLEVWTIKDGQLKTEEHIDRFINFMRFWQNSCESKKTSMRVSDTQREMVKAGKFVGGKAPYGYKLVPSGEISNHGRLLKKLEIVPEDAEVVRKIFDYAIYDGMGYDRIANTLNKEGIPAPTTEKWKRSTIASILKNPIYMGYYAINRRKNHGSFKRLDRKDWIYSERPDPDLIIISQKDWERAQEIREARKNTINQAKEVNHKQYKEQHNVPFSTSGKLLLIGLAYCGYCGKRLKNGSYCNHWTVKSTGEKKSAFSGRYVCPEKCKERSCYSQSYLEDIVENVVSSYMRTLKNIDISEELQKIQKQKRTAVQKELKQLQKEQSALKLDIETLEEKIPEAIRGDYCFSVEKLSDLIKEKEKALEEAKQRTKIIQSELSAVDIQDEELKQFINHIPNWEELYTNAEIPEKQMILASLIDKIIVKDDDITIRFKINIENFIDNEQFKAENEVEKEENLLLETVGTEVPKPRLRFHHYFVYGI